MVDMTEGVPIVTTNPTPPTDDAIVRRLRQLRSGPDSDRYTELARWVAHALVDRRAGFQTRDGHPDWTGSTHAYKAWLRDLYSRAGYNDAPDLKSRVQRAVAWHVAARVREVVPADELARLGLAPSTIHERNRASRAARSSLVEAARQSAGPGQSPVQWAGAALALVERAASADADALSLRDRRLWLAALERVAQLASDAVARVRAGEVPPSGVAE